jgi:two-component system LytT family response regulator
MIRRAKGQIRGDRDRNLADRLDAALAELGGRPREPNRLAVKKAGRIYLVRAEDVDWLEADGNHVRLHIGKDAHLIRDTLARVEERLPAGAFMRIHRSTIVNVSRIREIQPWFQGDYVLLLTDGTRLTSGRSYRERVRSLFDS